MCYNYIVLKTRLYSIDMSLKDIVLPNYKLRHELWNSITHGLVALFGISALILMLLKINGIFVPNGSHIDVTDIPYAIVSVTIYASSIIVCMSISCIYHALKKNNGKKVMRIIDHDMVFFLVAGTYTPYCLISLRTAPLWNISNTNFSGWILFGIVYVLVALGITMNSINIHKYSALSMIIYLFAGWSIVLNCVELYKIIEFNGFILLLTGGISFSIGAILYGLGKKKSVWWHTVFHIFVAIGIILQFLSIYLYVL